MDNPYKISKREQDEMLFRVNAMNEENLYLCKPTPIYIPKRKKFKRGKK